MDDPLSAFLSTSAISDVGFYCRLSQVWCSLFSRGAYASGQVHPPSLKVQMPFFLQLVAPHQNHYAQTSSATVCGVTADIIDAMYVEAGESAGTFAQKIYLIDPNDYQQKQLADCGPNLAGFVDYSLNQASIVQEALAQPDRDRRIHALQMLLKGGVPIDRFVAAISTSAVSVAKREREIATALLQRNPQAAVPVLQAKAESGNSSERQQAVKLLWELAGEEVRPFLESRLALEKAAKVRSVIEQLMATPTERVVEETALALPTLPKVVFDVPVPENAVDVLEKIKNIFERDRIQARRNFFQNLKKIHSSTAYYGVVFEKNNFSKATVDAIMTLLDETTANPQLDDEEALLRFSAIIDQNQGQSAVTLPTLIEILQKATYADCCEYQHLCGHHPLNLFTKEIQPLLTLPEFHLIHVVRLFVLLGYEYRSAHYFLHHEGHELLLFYRKHHLERGDLRQLAAVLESLEIPPDCIGYEILNSWGAAAFGAGGTRRYGCILRNDCPY